MSAGDKPPRSTPSGEHPAVIGYRKKLVSVDLGVSAATSALDRKLSEYLEEIKTPPPPAPDESTLEEVDSTPVGIPPPLPRRR